MTIPIIFSQLRRSYLSNRNLSDRKFAQLCQIPRPRMVAILDGRAAPEHQEIVAIHAAMQRLDDAAGPPTMLLNELTDVTWEQIDVPSTPPDPDRNPDAG
jgi:hypothetical protein